MSSSAATSTAPPAYDSKHDPPAAPGRHGRRSRSRSQAAGGMSSGPKDVGRLSGASVAAVASVRPRLRGVSHKYAFFASLACGVALILTASGGESTIAAAIYAGAVSALLGTSAL